jgi:hypothetical protein
VRVLSNVMLARCARRPSVAHSGAPWLTVAQTGAMLIFTARILVMFGVIGTVICYDHSVIFYTYIQFDIHMYVNYSKIRKVKIK